MSFSMLLRCGGAPAIGSLFFFLFVYIRNVRVRAHLAVSFPFFLRAALLLLGRESFLPYVSDLWVVASEGEAFHSFESGAGDMVLRGGGGAGNRAVRRHVEA